MDIIKREADFEKYCQTCKYKDLNEVKDPCNDCLDQTYNYDTDKPVKYEPVAKNA